MFKIEGKFETLGDLYRHLRMRLLSAEISHAELDARWLTADAAGVVPQDVVLKEDTPLSSEAAQRALNMLARRLSGEPVDRILGFREFWGLRFALEPETLSPRPDSETLVAAAISSFAGRSSPSRILDLGTGTGALLIALLSHWPQATGIGVDRSYSAAAVARYNAAINQVADRAHFLVSDWAGALQGSFDLIVSNPPYIVASEIAGLPSEVREYDPKLALDGGADGLNAYRTILSDGSRLLHKHGVMVLELGMGQEPAVTALSRAASFEPLGPAHPDLGGIPRALVLRPIIGKDPGHARVF